VNDFVFPFLHSVLVLQQLSARSGAKGQFMSDEIPRRIRLDRMTTAEKIIFDAVQEVERVGADVRLTDAVILLKQARDKVADYVDEN
jgi:hypothetical protein